MRVRWPSEHKPKRHNFPTHGSDRIGSRYKMTDVFATTDDSDTPGSTFPSADPGVCAIFVDFDGTLVEIADRPEAVIVPDALPGLLSTVVDMTDGAACIVSGRSVEVILSFLPSFAGDIVGCHGGETRIGGVASEHRLSGSEEVKRLFEDCAAFAEERPGVQAEPKPTGAVLHYRRASEAVAQEVKDYAAELERRHGAFELHPAKMALEFRPPDVGKEKAVERLMRAAPYAGRMPVYFGDDTTDEPALSWVRARGGLSVKVGTGETGAEFRAESPQDVTRFLQRMTQKE